MSIGMTVEDSPLEMLLKEQGTLQTPVGVFSAKHESLKSEPEQAQFYKQLLPLSKPNAGEQYAFRVDLDKCTGCKACVTACHSLNGLEESETWRDVGTVQGFDETGAYAQTVTTACHHCADPGCLNGCPVLAYEKDPETGIVRHLDDQCIGCQYCVLKCPYDVPKFSKKLGIVRKCDMCHSRLAEGEAPACVQGCPTEAISITIINTLELTQQAKESNRFLSGAAPAPNYTVPTTQYITERSVPINTEAADSRSLKAEHTHFPLVLMLTLTQAAVGCLGAALFTSNRMVQIALTSIGFIAMAFGLAASTSHLGRPLGAWRAFLGLRRSWLSREIIIFGGSFPLAAIYTFGVISQWLPTTLVQLAGLGAVFSGLLGVFCSAMIYHDTQRPFWRISVSGSKFFGTTLCLGLTATYSMTSLFSESNGLVLSFALFGFILKLCLEASHLIAVRHETETPAKQSALIMLNLLRPILKVRLAIGCIGFVLLWGSVSEPSVSIPAFGMLFVGELLERILFFKAVVAPKMPGGVRV